MRMFETFLASIPTNRLDYVNELEIPDVTLSPYLWDPDEEISSLTTDCEAASLSTESSLALSRAMTDSDIDYDKYKQYKNLYLSNPWDQLRLAMEAFPSEYLASFNSLQSTSSWSSQDSIPYEPLPPNEELRLKMERFLEECHAFTPDDPAFTDMEEVLLNIDLESLYASLDIVP